MKFSTAAIASLCYWSCSPTNAFTPSCTGVSRSLPSSTFLSSTVTSSETATAAADDVTTTRVMRPPIDLKWQDIQQQLVQGFGYDAETIQQQYNVLHQDKQSLLKLYKAMEMARGFENACNQQYMQGKIRGFMHLDNGQEAIPALVDYAIQTQDKKFSYYREHTHAIASGVDPKLVMAELMMKDTGTCRGAGGSMHIFDKPNYFQGGWALVGE
jgi:2-oxoisovalerate dehydrogenase E1 component